MQTVFSQLMILYLFLFAGWLMGKLKKEKAAHADILSVLLVNLFLPSKVFLSFANQFSPSYFFKHASLPLAGCVLLLVLVLLSFGLAKLFAKGEYEKRVYRYSSVITNYAYLGYALIGAVFGEDTLAQFMLFAIPFIVYTYTVGYALLTGGKKPLRRLLNPITVAIALGMLTGLSGLSLPQTLTSALSMASACVGPLSMLLTGMTLSAFFLKELLSDKKAYWFSALRLVGIPALGYGICRCFGLTELLPMVLIITCMPCGLNTIVFPKLIGEDCKPGARLAFITHIFSAVSLPLWLSLI